MAAIEAILFVSGRPVSRRELAAVTELPDEAVSEAIEGLDARYADGGGGVTLREVAGGFQLVTKPELAPLIERYRGEARPSPLSPAALESLACVLYLGPLTRGGISRVRGVNSDAVVRSLIERKLITESGREHDAPGAPSLLDVSEDFFIASGSSSRSDFPDIDELVSEEELERVRERVVSVSETPGAGTPGVETGVETQPPPENGTGP